MGLHPLLISADGHAIRAAMRAEANRAEQRAEAEAVRAEQREESCAPISGVKPGGGRGAATVGPGRALTRSMRFLLGRSTSTNRLEATKLHHL